MTVEKELNQQPELSWYIEEGAFQDPDGWSGEGDVPVKRFRITTGNTGGPYLLLYKKPDYPDDLYLEDIFNNPKRSGIRLHQRDFKNLIGKILECLGKSDCDKIYAHSQSITVSKMLDRLGADTDEARGFEGDKDFPLRTLTREQLQAALGG